MCVPGKLNSHDLCFKCAPTQVSLGGSCLEADHVISALPASGNG